MCTWQWLVTAVVPAASAMQSVGAIRFRSNSVADGLKPRGRLAPTGIASTQVDARPQAP